METVGFQAVIGGLNEYLAGIDQMVQRNAKQAQGAIASANAAAKQADADVKAAKATLDHAKTLDQARAAWTSLTAAEEKASQANINAAATAAKLSSTHAGVASTLKSAAVAAAQLATAYLGFKALDSAIKQTAEFGDATYRLKMLTGQTAESASALLYGAEKLGVSWDKLSAGLRIFSRNMLTVVEENDGFTSSAKTTKEILQSMGVAVMDANGNLLPFDTLLGSVADKFKGMADGPTKAGLAAQLFSRSGAALLPILNLGADGIRKFDEEAKKLGHSLSEQDVKSIHDYVIAQREFNAAIHGIQIEIGEAAMPYLVKFSEWFQKNQPTIRAFLSTLIGDVAKFASAFGEGFKVIESVLSWLPANQSAVVAAILAIGTAFAWAVPGGPVLVGLALVVASLGEIRKHADVQSLTTKAAHFIDSKLGLSQANENKQFGILGGADLSKKDSEQAKATDEAADAITGLDDGLAKLNNDALKSRADLDYLGDTLAGVARNAARSAASALFSSPTREEAGLDLQIAQAKIPVIQAEIRDAPQIDALTMKLSQLKDVAEQQELTLEAQLDAAKRSVEVARANADAVKEVAQANKQALEDSISNLHDAADASLNQARDAAQAQADASARMIDLLSLQLEALQQSRSALQASFLKQNEELQTRINQAIGRGDTSSALSLVQQQKVATSQYRAADAGNLASQQNLTVQEKTAQASVGEQSRATAVALKKLEEQTNAYVKSREKEAKAEEKKQDASVKAAEDGVKAAEAREKGMETAANGVKKSFEASEKAIQKHIDALKADEDKYKKQAEALDRQKQLLDAQHGVMKAQLVLADKSLLTEAELQGHYEKLLPLIAEASQAYRDAAKATGDDLIPEFDKLRGALLDMKQYGVTTTKEELIKLMQAAKDATLRVGTLATSSQQAAAKIAAAGGTVDQVIAAAAAAGKTGTTTTSNTTTKSISNTAGFTKTSGGAPLFDDGGIVTSPTFNATLALNSQPEVVLPLAKPARSRELLAMLPTAVLMAMLPKQSGAGARSIFGDMNVSGFTLQDMKAAAHQAVDQAFARAFATAGRAGAYLPQGVGNGAS